MCGDGLDKHMQLASRFFDDVGDGSGNIHMNINGSITPVEFKITCPPKTIYRIHRVIVQIQDSGTFDANSYGNKLELTNGVQILTHRPTRVVPYSDITAQLPIRTNAKWGAYSYDTTLLSYGTGDSVLSIRYTVTKDGAHMQLGPGESLILRVNDDLTGLVDHYGRVGFTEFAT